MAAKHVTTPLCLAGSSADRQQWLLQWLILLLLEKGAVGAPEVASVVHRAFVQDTRYNDSSSDLIVMISTGAVCLTPSLLAVMALR